MQKQEEHCSKQMNIKQPVEGSQRKEMQVSKCDNMVIPVASKLVPYTIAFI